MTTLNYLDYSILLAYLLVNMAIGVWISRRINTDADYFLAGRQLPWWAIGMSLVATDIGGTDVIGVGGAAYKHGLAVGNFEWIGCVPAMLIAAFVFMPFFWRIGIYTIPEYLERRYNAAVRGALACCWLAFMACNLGVMLLASSKVVTVLVGWEPTTCIIVTAVLVGVYTVSGGLAAIVYTDVLQCSVMIGGCLLVTVLGLIDLGGIGNFRAKLQGLETTLVLPVDTESPFPWTGILFGLAFILSPAYWIGNQAIVQRAFGAKSAFEAKAAYVWGALLKSVIPFIIAVPGLIAMIKFPGLEDTDEAIPRLVADLMPVGFRGVFLAAFLAALMSSVDSYLNSAATMLTRDLYQRFLHPTASERFLLLVGRITTIALVVWAIFFSLALMGMRGSGLYAIFQTLMSFFQGPAFAVLLCGLFWRRATGKGAFVGFLCGVLMAVTLYTLNQPAIYERLELRPLFKVADPYLYFSIWAFLTTLGVLIPISLLTKPDPVEKQEYVIGGNPPTATFPAVEVNKA